MADSLKLAVDVFAVFRDRLWLRGWLCELNRVLNVGAVGLITIHQCWPLDAQLDAYSKCDRIQRYRNDGVDSWGTYVISSSTVTGGIFRTMACLVTVRHGSEINVEHWETHSSGRFII